MNQTMRSISESIAKPFFIGMGILSLIGIIFTTVTSGWESNPSTTIEDSEITNDEAPRGEPNFDNLPDDGFLPGQR